MDVILVHSSFQGFGSVALCETIIVAVIVAAVVAAVITAVAVV